MTYQHVVTLKNERGKYINIISLLLALVSAMFFLFQQIRQASHTIIFLISFILIIAGLIFNCYIFSIKRRKIYYSWILLVAGVTWFAMPILKWMGLFFVLLSFLEKRARCNVQIQFTDDKIILNTLFRRKFYWNQFNNILLKDGLLTLDFKNNKVFQKLIIEKEGDTDEIEFNKYCNKQLKATSFAI